MDERTCPGTMHNDPTKTFTRCDTCHAIDYEKNEGDRCGRPRNRYEEKVEARRERYAERAAKASQESARAFESARIVADGIPMGQPILVGHHSEGRHRRDIARIDRGMRKGIEAESKAAHYAHKAETYGTHGISSDDPAAVAKLRAELAALEASRDLEKAANAAIRKAAKARRTELRRDLTGADHAELIPALGLRADIAKHLMSYARAFPWLPQFGSNTAASIKRVQKRIDELLAKEEMPDREVRGDGYSVEWNKADNREQIYFVDRQPDATVAKLKQHGFRWARSIAAWQRHASEGAWYHALQIVGHKEPTECGECKGTGTVYTAGQVTVECVCKDGAA